MTLKTRLFKILRLGVQISLYVLEKILDAADFVQERLLRLVFRREYVRQGSCQRTGQCCQAIGLEVPASWLKFPRLMTWVKRWHFLRYNFTCHDLVDTMLVYSCNYLTAEGTCGIQRFKPKLCRDFPQRPWRGFIRLHKGCGYYFIRNGGRDFSQVLSSKKQQ